MVECATVGSRDLNQRLARFSLGKSFPPPMRREQTIALPMSVGMLLLDRSTKDFVISQTWRTQRGHAPRILLQRLEWTNAEPSSEEQQIFHP
jgi:hypothetical protein